MPRTLAILMLPVLAVGLGAASPSTTAGGQGLTLMGHSLTEACSEHAQRAGEGSMAPSFAVDTCTAALEEEAATPADRAATRNNRGVVLLTLMGKAEEARLEFESAASLDPGLGESYANRGAALVAEGRWREAVTEIDRALTMTLREPWKAYFNRAIAREGLSDIPGAYADFSKAGELRPGWALVETQLARFAIRRR